MEILQNINPKDFFNSDMIIQYAFSVGKRHYFRFDDALNIPYQRGLQALVFYKELDCNVSRDFLKAHCQAIANIFKQPQLDVDHMLTIRNIGKQLEARLDLPKEPELMYKFASVVFFDQFENPAVYEFKYGAAKIKHWKKETKLEDFFLSRPLRTLIPYLIHADENLKQFSLMTEKAAELSLETISPLLSDEQKTTYLNRLK